ncbi:MAG: cell division protein FtsZ [Bacteroidales bacterium]
MEEDIMKFDIPEVKPAIIKVIGVGGGGGNAVNHMFMQGIKDVDFVLCNTDAQALAKSPIPVKIQIGTSITQGRGAGNNPDRGKEAAIESLKEVENFLVNNTQMVFITAGMGGGTGTGAAPIIAEICKKNKVLTVGIITMPFKWEGPRRLEQAKKGVEELRKHVDSLLIINNDKLREIYGNLTFSEGFAKADDVLTIAAKGIAEIITVPGKINVDFADVQTVMANSGVAIMGSASASGENRAIKAVEEALRSPLLNNADINGAKNILLNITTGKTAEITFDEIDEIMGTIQSKAGNNADVIWGCVIDPSFNDQINVTVIATGFEINNLPDFSDFGLRIPKNIVLKECETDIDETDDIENDDILNESQDKLKPKIFYLEEEEPERKPYKKASTTIKKEVDADFIIIEGSNEKVRQPEIDFQTAQQASQSKVEPKQNNVQQTINSNVSGFNYKHVRELDDITEYENVPAFIRQKKTLTSFNSEEELSKYTLAEKKNGKMMLKEHNSFIHDNVD